MGWVGTAYDLENGIITEFHNDGATHGRHGDYAFNIKGLYDDKGVWHDADKPIFVMVHDNSDNGTTHEERKKIAERACVNPIHWSDHLLRYWMYDFEIYGHWCEMVDVGSDGSGEPYWECLHINVYR